jgi:hypothetical protein
MILVSLKPIHLSPIRPFVRFFVPVRKGAEDAGRLLQVEVTYTGPPDSASL